MANSKKEKVNKNPDKISKDTIAVLLVLAIIAVYIFTQCYSATHTEVETITAVTSTVYDTVEAKALVIRQEHTVNDKMGYVTVANVADGEKVKVNGEIAMEFTDEESAKNYSSLQELHKELDYYIELESKSAGVATNIESLDKDIISDVNSYVRTAASGNTSGLADCTDSLNDKLTRRQMIIGESIDFSAVKSSLEEKINSINADTCKPAGYLTTEQSGIFSSYTDGFETVFDYTKAENIDVATLKSYIEQASARPTGEKAFGKLITAYEWYFCAVVSTDDIAGIKNGDTLDVSVKGSDDIIKCTVVSGADTPPGEKETALVLRCSQMNSEIASMRLEDIEIRYNSYTGFKVPASAIHIDDEGKKCVYALVANKVSLRKGEIIYSTKDYAVFSYDPENSDSIRLYDRIITKGKDLHDGKVYT